VSAVLVTGGGTGIGAAVARVLREAGDEVAILGRRPEALAAVAASTGALDVVCDVSDVNGAVIPVDGAGIAVDVGTLPFDPRVEVRPDP
jgi:meso-butanediol dehydrogenase/(S,S)-butanediol dehydrogenase/diacetyl reductase